MAGSQLFEVGAAVWELARLCSALAQAVEGVPMPLASARSPFIHQDGRSS